MGKGCANRPAKQAAKLRAEKLFTIDKKTLDPI
jgi:hypothetical protein